MHHYSLHRVSNRKKDLHDIWQVVKFLGISNILAVIKSNSVIFLFMVNEFICETFKFYQFSLNFEGVTEKGDSIILTGAKT